jgi:nicotinamide riboside transporter PnuC
MEKKKHLIANLAETSKIGLAGLIAGVFCVVFSMIYALICYLHRRE